MTAAQAIRNISDDKLEALLDEAYADLNEAVISDRLNDARIAQDYILSARIQNQMHRFFNRLEVLKGEHQRRHPEQYEREEIYDDDDELPF